MKRIRFDLNVKLNPNVKFDCSGRAKRPKRDKARCGFKRRTNHVPNQMCILFETGFIRFVVHVAVQRNGCDFKMASCCDKTCEKDDCCSVCNTQTNYKCIHMKSSTSETGLIHEPAVNRASSGHEIISSAAKGDLN